MINKPRFLAITLIFIVFVSCFTYSVSAKKTIENSLLRLHIIANSDADFDQKLKISVRDAVLRDCAHLFENAKSRQETLLIAEENLSVIEDVAEKEIARLGYSYPVKAVVEREKFPVKRYENIVLPAGDYDAVRILIGEGAGKNWWCVMYPPLCFVDEATVRSGKETLKASLSPLEYELIASEDALPVEFRFKILELIEKITP